MLIILYTFVTLLFPTLLMCALITSRIIDEGDSQKIKFVKGIIGLGVSCVLVVIAVFVGLSLIYGLPI